MKPFLACSLSLVIVATSVLFKASAQTTSANLPTITLLNYVHSYESGKAQPLEKAMGKSSNKRKGLGYGGTEMRVEINGATSSVKLAETMNSFIINMGSNTLPDLVLLKMKGEKNKRYAVTGLLTISGPKSSDDMLSFDLSKLGDGVYGIKVTGKLEKGEYCFASKPNLSLTATTAANDVYAFSIQ